MKKQLNYNILGKFLKKELAEKETEDFLNNTDIDEIKKIKEIWDQSGNAFNNAKPNSDKMWQMIDLKTSLKKPKIITFNPILKIAASILLLFAIGSTIYFSINKNNKLLIASADNHLKLKIELVDGSAINLNQSSTLKYPAKFKTKTREVYLEGEAFFKITRNTKKPFIIHAHKTTVEVLGTSFNVRAYNTENEIAVSVVTGMVKVTVNDKETKKEITLEKGEEGIFNQTIDTLYKLSSFSMNELAWKTGKLSFKETELAEVCKILSKYYFKKIIVVDTSIKKLPFTANFENKPLEEILTVMNYALDIKYEYKNDIIILSGN